MTRRRVGSGLAGWGLASLTIGAARWAFAQGAESGPAVPPAPIPGPPPSANRWSGEERARLDRYARATWRSFEAMAAPDGLPADRLRRDPGGAWAPSNQATPTDIAAYLWSTLAAEALGIVEPAAAEARLAATLTTLERADRPHGFFLALYDPATGRHPGVRGNRGQTHRPFLSTVDNGWLAASLTMIRNTRPGLRDRAEAILATMDFGFFYEPFDAADPVRHPGQFHGGYYTDDRTFTAFYGMLNTEPRIASYLAIARGQVPPDHYYRLYRTLPADHGPQRQAPRGSDRTFGGVRVFEGAYEADGARVVPSWGGSLFEALMVPLFVPEGRWSPRSWGVNHPLHVRGQVAEGLGRRRYGAWGFSPCDVPEGGYATFGVPSLATSTEGYPPFEVPPGGKADAADPRAGVVTPHASFLALAFDPRAALDNLDHLERRFPIFGPMGFHDSVNVATGAVSPTALALDQGMILASIANALRDDVLHHALCDGPFEAAIRPLIAPEAFASRNP